MGLTVAREDDGAALGSILRRATGGAWSATKRLIERGAVTVDGVVVKDPGTRVRAGQSVALDPRRSSRQGDLSLPRDRIVHLDKHLVVVDKPAGISTVPFDEGERGTLVDRVRIALHRAGEADANAPLFVVHRIDKETSGLVVFARTWVAKRHLASLFRAHVVEREYLAIVLGHLAHDRITYDTHLVENRGDGLRGSAKQPGMGVRAVTHVERIAHSRSHPATLIRCKLETGKTHQIRIHLAEAGHPLVGERVYSRHWKGPQIDAPRMMLHAATLGFSHPARPEELLSFRRPVPEDFLALATQLGLEKALPA